MRNRPDSSYPACSKSELTAEHRENAGGHTHCPCTKEERANSITSTHPLPLWLGNYLAVKQLIRLYQSHPAGTSFAVSHSEKLLLLRLLMFQTNLGNQKGVNYLQNLQCACLPTKSNAENKQKIRHGITTTLPPDLFLLEQGLGRALDPRANGLLLSKLT